MSYPPSASMALDRVMHPPPAKPSPPTRTAFIATPALFPDELGLVIQSAQPRPDSYSIELVKGELYLTGKRVSLGMPKSQRFGMEGSFLQRDMTSVLFARRVLPGWLVDVLHARPTYIPESWQAHRTEGMLSIFFWGTIYDSGGPCVRFLRFERPTGWIKGFRSLTRRWKYNDVAAML